MDGGSTKTQLTQPKGTDEQGDPAEPIEPPVPKRRNGLAGSTGTCPPPAQLLLPTAV